MDAKTNGSALIALGTNLPFRGVSGPALLTQAASALRAAGLTPRKSSGMWETDPWPPDLPGDQPSFTNAVLEVDPRGATPQGLYGALREIEKAFGRERRERWGPRTLDLDILAMAEFVGRFGEITLPHPRLHERAFVLAPLAEAAPDWRHPVSGAGPAEMMGRLGSEARVRRLPDPGPRG